MRLPCLIIVASLAAACGNNAPIASNQSTEVDAASRGNEIVAEHLHRDDAPYRKEHVRITVRSENEAAKEYELEASRRQTSSETDTYTVILKPAEDAGTATLAIQKVGQPTVLVTYSASRDDFRESDANKMFFGGLTAQELLGEYAKYDYTDVGERQLDGASVHELNGKLKPDQTSVIASSKMSIGTTDYLLYEMHLFDSAGHEIRSYKESNISSGGGRPYVSRTEVDNPVYKCHVTLEISSREFPPSIDDQIFTRGQLKQVAKK